MAALLLGLLLGSFVLLTYIFQSCGPRKQAPGTPNPRSPPSVTGPICPSPGGSAPTDLIPHSSWPSPLPLPGDTNKAISSPGLSPSSPRVPLPSPLGEPSSLFPPSSEFFPTGSCERPACGHLLSHYLASKNTSVAPCTDFFSFACGNAKGTSDPFQALAEESRSRLRRILGKECRAKVLCAHR